MMLRRACQLSLLASTALAAAFGSSPVLAQDGGGELPDAAGAGAGAAPAGNEIIVTAQKFQQRAQDVPITISALSGERIGELGVTDLDELSAYVPGLNIQEQSANNPGIVIRGITSDSGSAQQGPRVTLYYNGVDVSRSRGSYQAIYDMERIEVIKGPQATLFGTASAVGAISLVSARPREGVSAELTGGYGNFDQTLLAGFFNAGTQNFAARIAFEWKQRDGYVENLATSQDEELYALDNLGLRASMRFTQGADFTLDVIGTYDRQRNGGTPFISGSLPTEAGPADPFGEANLGGSPVSQSVLGNDQLGLDREVYDINATASYEISDTLSFTTVNGYREFDSREVFDADGSAAWYLEFAEIADGWQASHEGRFSYEGSRLRGSVGWNYFVEEGIQNVPFSTEEGTYIECASNITAGAPFNLTIPCVAQDGTVGAAQVTAILTQGAASTIPYSSVFENQGKNDAVSVFADLTWLATDRLELTAGLRHLWEGRESGYFAQVPDSVISGAPLIPGQIDTAGQTFRAQEDYSASLPRFNVLFRATPDLNLYATVAKGRRSPVVQVTATRDAGGNPVRNLQLVPEETVWNYEGGAKLSTAMVSGSLGVFYQDYEGFQVSVIQPDGSSLTESAGSAGNLGVEAEAAVRPAEWISLFANGAYIDAKIDEDSALDATYSGARFRLQSKWQAAAGLTIDRDLGGGMRLFATPSVTYRSRLYFELPNSELLSQGPVTLVHARAGLSFAEGRLELAGFIRNAFDEDFLLDAGNTGGAFGIPTFIPGEPRFYGVEATARLF